MLRRIAMWSIVAAVALSTVGMPQTLAASDTASSLTLDQAAAGFNDKMLILHKGKEICVDWWAWPGHVIIHGDALLGSCDRP